MHTRNQITFATRQSSYDVKNLPPQFRAMNFAGIMI
jgi:hypothetical protein